MKKLEVALSRRARRDLRKLNAVARARTLNAVYQYAEARRGYVKKLTAADYQYRLRVGRWRILFDKDDSAGTMYVGRIRDRREAY